MASRLNEGNFVRFQGKTPTGVRTEEIEKCLIIGSLRYGTTDYGLRLGVRIQATRGLGRLR